MTIINILFFCITVILSMITIYRMFFLSQNNDAAIMHEFYIPKKIYPVLFGIITSVAIFIRIYRFGSIPSGFNQDGAMAAVDAKSLADYGTDRFGMYYPVHLTAWGYSQMSSLLSYIMVPFIKLFGFSTVTLRMPQLLMSLASLFCLYALVRDILGKNAGLIIFFFAAINPWHILQSRWTLEANLYPHFFLIGIFFLNLALKKQRRILYLCLSMIMFGLCMYCYGVSIYTMPLFLLIACIYLLVKKEISVKETVLSFFVYMFISWPFIMVMAINFFKWDTITTPFFTLPYFPDSVRSNDILFFSEHIGTQLIANLKSLLCITLFRKR